MFRLRHVEAGLVIQTSDDGWIWQTITMRGWVGPVRDGIIKDTPITYSTEEEAVEALEALKN